MTWTEHRCAVLGHPIAHSLSPVLHAAAYGALGLHGWSYAREDVEEPALPGFLESRDASWVGLSLTMPLKRTVRPFGSPSDRWSRELGVSNTAVLGFAHPSAEADSPSKARSRGAVAPDSSATEPTSIALYNTDVHGIERAIRHARPDSPSEADVVVLGNGNTALSALAACTMLFRRSRITVLARRPQKPTPLEGFASRHGRSIAAFRSLPLSEGMTSSMLPDCDLVISTLPPHAADDLARALLAAATTARGTLLDVAYDPHPSLLRSVWERLGGVGLGGEEMLLYQAIDQVELMVGAVPEGRARLDATDPLAVEAAMRDALARALTHRTIR
ncbi:shikimate dehydrogenase [uncultured Bifidobacterium sp.]|uniref:shikimate dehydrogenase family protein n=1 Tax=uncultured Bifidobacterium sp. TaxID=165187 RepID=UPI0028DBF916|nr:shikimate dehydrogenase [uncultured Bifidobacterium sp.]